MLITAGLESQSQRTRYIPKDARSISDLLADLLTGRILLPEDWEALDRDVQETIRDGNDVIRPSIAW